ncbi:MAG: ABC-2 transporter permease [Acidobacteria bacterium]|nr:ABC-2 transporter permease [Acidobacteriota bacterium]MBV9145113.1 ABC-2 transporter permease [Acidobacteriota bacterium]MBV9434729.1 ABC-2 transporter permease [Acidobacteriota bacterium]
MKANVELQLILKDWRLQRQLITLTFVAGATALSILLIGTQTPAVIGTVFFFVSMVFCACLLPMQNIVNERKKQTLAFVMSLPVSSARYGAAKLISTVGLFVILWLTLLGAGFFMILSRHVLPVGAIPAGLIIMNFPLIGFCLLTGTALVGESEGWATAMMAVVNSSYWLAWYLLASRLPDLTKTWGGPVAVWSPAVVKILVVEFAMILVILGVTLYLQSRKRNFI